MEINALLNFYIKKIGEELSGSTQLSGVGARTIQDHIIATQMNRLNREMPISDVYHERNIGLGLAPPLSELLVTSSNSANSTNPGNRLENTVTATSSSACPAVASSSSQVENCHPFTAFDQISLADNVELDPQLNKCEAHVKTYATKRPLVGRLNKLWMPATAHQNFRHHRSTNFESDSDTNFTPRHTSMDRRDEADGRSMTDSNYSGYSPHRNLKLSTLLPTLSRHLADQDEDLQDPHDKLVVAVIEAEAGSAESAAMSNVQ